MNMDAITIDDCLVANEFGKEFVIENGHIVEVLERKETL